MDENDRWGIKLIAILAGCMILVFLLVMASIEEENNRSECESIGGTYQVIKREFIAVPFLHTSEIWGCVK